MENPSKKNETKSEREQGSKKGQRTWRINFYEDYSMHFRAIRKYTRMTQAVFAEKLEICVDSIKKYENGMIHLPGKEIFNKYLEFGEVTEDYFHDNPDNLHFHQFVYYLDYLKDEEKKIFLYLYKAENAEQLLENFRKYSETEKDNHAAFLRDYLKKISKPQRLPH